MISEPKTLDALMSGRAFVKQNAVDGFLELCDPFSFLGDSPIIDNGGSRFIVGAEQLTVVTEQARSESESVSTDRGLAWVLLFAM